MEEGEEGPSMKLLAQRAREEAGGEESLNGGVKLHGCRRRYRVTSRDLPKGGERRASMRPKRLKRRRVRADFNRF